MGRREGRPTRAGRKLTVALAAVGSVAALVAFWAVVRGSRHDGASTSDTFVCETDKAKYYMTEIAVRREKIWTLKRVDRTSGQVTMLPEAKKLPEGEQVLSLNRMMGWWIYRSDVRDAPARPTELQWGPADPSGLQMAAYRETSRPIVWCVIRNNGQTHVRYNQCFLAYWEGIWVEARPKGVTDG